MRLKNHWGHIMTDTWVRVVDNNWLEDCSEDVSLHVCYASNDCTYSACQVRAVRVKRVTLSGQVDEPCLAHPRLPWHFFFVSTQYLGHNWRQLSIERLTMVHIPNRALTDEAASIFRRSLPTTLHHKNQELLLTITTWKIRFSEQKIKL